VLVHQPCCALFVARKDGLGNLDVFLQGTLDLCRRVQEGLDVAQEQAARLDQLPHEVRGLRAVAQGLVELAVGRLVVALAGCGVTAALHGCLDACARGGVEPACGQPGDGRLQLAAVLQDVAQLGQ
jgi:hypothetical protein